MALLGSVSCQEELYDNAARFASGFFVGARVGRFEEIDLLECIKREPSAIEVFRYAEEKFKEGIDTHNEQLGVEGLHSMIIYITAVTTNAIYRIHPLCAQIVDPEKSDWSDMERILGKVENPDTDIKYSDDKLLFNNRDITEEGEQIADLFNRDHFKDMG